MTTTSAPRLAEGWQQRARIVPLADGLHPLVIIDDALAEPEAVRRLALASQFQPRDAAFPGQRSRPFDASALTDGVRQLIGALRDEAVETLPGEFALYTDEVADAQAKMHQVHIDDELDFVAITYLTEPGRCSGGTGFYRDARTGRIGFPKRGSGELAAWMEATGKSRTELLAEALGRPGPDELLRRFAAFLSAEPEAEDAQLPRGPEWEPVQLVPMRFNRLVAYDANLFHKPFFEASTFGLEPDSGRLILRTALRRRGVA